MILRGVNYGPVLQASGLSNLDGRGYWYHWPLKILGFSLKGSAIVTKTTTYEKRAGNMPLKKDGVTPKELIPRCIIVKRRQQAVLNAVSLSGPGLEFLLHRGWWQRFTEPFQISIMSLAKTPEGRRDELREILKRLALARRHDTFLADWGVQANWSCPNGGLDPNAILDEVIPNMEIADKILPQSVSMTHKFGPEVHPEAIKRIAREPRCDAICFCNTMPFGKHPTWSRHAPPIRWKAIFATDDPKESPMAKRFPGFPGGYSGAELLPFVIEWIEQVRALGISKPIIGGGGIRSPQNALTVFAAGADAISPGSIAMLAPSQMRPTIRFAHEYTRSLRYGRTVIQHR